MTDGNDTPMSSSDLLRQARDEFMGRTASDREGTETTAAEPARRVGAADQDAPAEPLTTMGRNPAPTPGATEKRQTDRVPAPSTLGTPEQVPAKSRTGMRLLARLIVPAVIFGGIFIYNTIDETETVESLTAGDCLLEPEAEEITTVEARGCGDSHAYEVFSVVTDPSPTSASYPGVEELLESIMVQCLDRFEGYVGTAYADSVYWANAIYPTEESWQDGDRTGTCLLFEANAQGDAVMRTGTLRSAGR